MFSWQVQYLVHFKVSLFMAGAIFDEVVQSTCTFSFHGRCKIWCIQLSLLVAGAIFGKIQTDPERKMLHFSIQNSRGEREK